MGVGPSCPEVVVVETPPPPPTVVEDVNVAKYASGTLTNKEILEMNKTPVVVVSAPGSGYAHIVMACYVQHVFGTTAFNSNTIALTYGNTVSGTAAMTAFADAPFDSTSNCLQMLPLAFQSTLGHGVGRSDMENKPLSFTTGSGLAFADGDGTGQYSIVYKTIAI